MKYKLLFGWIYAVFVSKAHVQAAHVHGVEATPMPVEDGGTTPMPHTMDTPHDDGMGMYFHGGTNEIVLFKKWDAMNWQDMLLTCLGLFLVAVLYEGFKIVRQVIFTKTQTPSKTQLLRESYQMTFNAYGSLETGQSASDNSTILDMTASDDGNGDCCTKEHRMCSGWHWVQSLLYIIQMFVGYCLMLSVMTYNVYIFIAVLVGAGVGHQLFAWIGHNQHTSSEVCH